MQNKYNSAVCFIRKYYLPDENNEPVLTNRINLTKQIAGFNEKQIRATYLLQYDALIDEFYSELIRKQEAEHGAEIGIWLEIVKPLAENSGVKFPGREHYIWDPYANAGFSCAYGEEDRKRLVDEIMEKFKSVYGYYPKSIGSWIIDSQTMQYIDEKYSPDIFIICRSQWGIDGYTLWGGPYYGPYYPCKNNMLCPAQKQENQINTPVFKLFVNDPIYSYYEYEQKVINDKRYELFTQEPAWQCGSDPIWVKWHYDTLFKNDCIGYAYTQLGQENSFGWTKMEKGFEYQIDFATKNKEYYGYDFVTLSELGRNFKQEYKETPISGRFVLDDWANNDNTSLWYNSKYYRINLCSHDGEVFIRDIHLFDDNYCDKYIKKPCTEKEAVYTNLPIMDGIRFGKGKDHACFCLGKGSITDVKRNGESYIVEINSGEMLVSIEESQVSIKSVSDFSIKINVFDEKYIEHYSDNGICYIFDGYRYNLHILEGYVKEKCIVSNDKKVVMSFKEGDSKDV